MQRRSLNFPAYDFKLHRHEFQEQILDPIRKKYVTLTPEEWVRQHVIRYLIENKKVPAGLIAVEKQFKYNQIAQRADVVVFDKQAKPALIVECKAPTVNINQETFEQIARYNIPLRVDYLMVTNGINHYFCRMDYEKWTYEFFKDLPLYDSW
jgi:hypothetical protein